MLLNILRGTELAPTLQQNKTKQNDAAAQHVIVLKSKNPGADQGGEPGRAAPRHCPFDSRFRGGTWRILGSLGNGVHSRERGQGPRTLSLRPSLLASAERSDLGTFAGPSASIPLLLVPKAGNEDAPARLADLFNMPITLRPGDRGPRGSRGRGAWL